MPTKRVRAKKPAKKANKPAKKPAKKTRRPQKGGFIPILAPLAVGALTGASSFGVTKLLQKKFLR